MVLRCPHGIDLFFVIPQIFCWLAPNSTHACIVFGQKLDAFEPDITQAAMLLLPGCVSKIVPFIHTMGSNYLFWE